MAKLYHYITKGNTALTEGILSFAQNPDADLSYYYKRTKGETTHDGIVKWMENCFEGRSRAIRGFPEPIQWTDKSINMFKPFIENADLFSIDLDGLQRDGLIEAVYVSPAIRPNLDGNFPQNVDERLVKLSSIDDNVNGSSLFSSFSFMLSIPFNLTLIPLIGFLSYWSENCSFSTLNFVSISIIAQR